MDDRAGLGERVQTRVQGRCADGDARARAEQGLDLARGHAAATDHEYGAVLQVGEQRKQGRGHGRIPEDRPRNYRARAVRGNDRPLW
ncbi:hypothetical protein N789_06665 [Arenimonas oryziterrae DSM 21050 = YC6267]|uniref:Uncharacterized protein n=1 Tax=Arenimonas oryziterrae DSM 21050 = YC6267 TaxID=1121015 RepID=A0A091AUX2_9GAMM|nr:hypothetical protein N789_06665 [Arenimonas oryziterrae DSM 21050 = YC6267]